MSTHALAFTIDAGTTGLTLKAALYSAGTIHATVRDATTGMHEIGQGFYEWLPLVIPDGYQGSAMFYTGTLGAASTFAGVSLIAAASVNPSEGGASDPESPVVTPPTPSVCVLFGVLRKPDGTIAAGEKITATLVVPRNAATLMSSALVSGRVAEATTDDDGEFTLNCLRTDATGMVPGCTYTVEATTCDLLKKRVTFTSGTRNINTLI